MLDGHLRNGGAIQCAINEFMACIEQKLKLENKYTPIHQDLVKFSDMDKEIPTYGVIDEKLEEDE